MRTLLVDNYDSFTYNLFHYLAEVSGHEPVVLRNDDSGWDVADLREFDNVVLSPGPGHPAVPADFGICREILADGSLPTLGVCLGHQGAALLYGATVERAPEPRHGRLSPVHHHGTGLFAGLPSPFEVVRYHSLAVTDLPEELTPSAWTEDGVLMGFEHRERPLWGLQFHPESILTRHGHDLLRNFTRLTTAWHAARPARPAPVTHRPSAVAPGTRPARPRPAEPVRKLRVLAEQLPTAWDEETVYAHLYGATARDAHRDGTTEITEITAITASGRAAGSAVGPGRGDHPFWLDGSGPDAEAARYSVMGDASGPLARVARARVADGTVTVRSAGGTSTVHSGLFDWLDRDLAGLHTELPPTTAPFALGWVGYLGYELKAECGGTAAHPAEDPDATLVFTDRALVFDHHAGTTTLLALAEEDTADPARTGEAAARAWLDRTAARLAALTGLPPAPAPRPAPLPGLALRHDRAAYLGLIDTCHEQIAAGETYEVCLTNMAATGGELDPWEGYRTLRRLSPAPYGALLDFDGLAVLSTSPERFLRIDPDGTAESKPIKGTRPRGATPEEDAALAAGLLADEKDRAENLMIVDLVRNDLGRHAEIGSVDAGRIFRVESYATVHQLVSTVRARLRPDRTAVDCVRAAFPAGSMTGAPKIRTMQLIDSLEQGPRGVYSGAIGYFSLSGGADLSVAIRTAVVTPGRVRYGVGGAVVALSDPAEEFEETAVKAAPLLALTGDGFPGRAPR
ncbi:aminodeoxychorismate synthase component I [Streptomyces sp. NPDC097619]|uniref:aminodeoxychorismate synthase component I n=1 Tax=Streptomyces sp. NPDC097619 TaxID=3157228 RepID=UPI003327C874